MPQVREPRPPRGNFSEWRLQRSSEHRQARQSRTPRRKTCVGTPRHAGVDGLRGGYEGGHPLMAVEAIEPVNEDRS